MRVDLSAVCGLGEARIHSCIVFIGDLSTITSAFHNWEDLKRVSAQSSDHHGVELEVQELVSYGRINRMPPST